MRAVALGLPRTTEGIVRDSVRFRVGKIVYVAISPDESDMGFAFPKEERDALVAGDPERFCLPRTSDLRFNWVVVHLDTIEDDEMRRPFESVTS